MTDPKITITITFAETEMRGRYRATLEGIDGVAELVILKVTPELIVAFHTEVPDSMGGYGVARALVAQLINDARKKGQRIVPFCPYFKAFAQKHPDDVADVIQW